MIVARSGSLALRLLGDGDDDVAVMARWLSDPRVLEWYGGRDRPCDAEGVRLRYGTTALEAEGVTAALIVDDGIAVGYVQWYEVGDAAPDYGLPRGEVDGVWAVDLFVGEPERWGSGLGTAALGLLVNHLLVTCRARRVVIDPRVVNERAIRSYRKVGFRDLHVQPEHEVHEGRAWDCLVMALDALDHPVGLTAHLARIDSVNPGLVDGAAGEAAISAFVAEWCADRGLEVDRREVAPGRWNVVARRRGRGGGASLVLNAHLDTVGPRATDVVLGDGRLEGRGVLDTKGGLAAAMLAVAAVDDGDLRGDVVLAAVADEEHGSLGTEALVGSIEADAAIVLEPTDLQVVHRHRGFAIVDAVITGRAAHTSRPERGINAVHAAALAVDAVAALDADWSADGTADPMSRPACLVSVLRHDGELFTVPQRCEITAEVRTTAQGHAEEVRAVVRAIGDGLSRSGVEVEVRPGLVRPALGVPADHRFVRTVADAVAAATGVEAVLAAMPYWTDAALHAGAGTPAVVFGPVGQGLHEDLEWVSIDSLHRCADALTRVARTWSR